MLAMDTRRVEIWQRESETDHTKGHYPRRVEACSGRGGEGLDRS